MLTNLLLRLIQKQKICIYKKLWDIDNNGKFTKPVEGTMGLLVNYNTVDYIELFKAEGE